MVTQWLLLIRHQCHCHYEHAHMLDPMPRGIPSARISLVGLKESGRTLTAITTEDLIALTATAEIHNIGAEDPCNLCQHQPQLTELLREHNSVPSPSARSAEHHPARAKLAKFGRCDCYTECANINIRQEEI